MDAPLSDDTDTNLLNFINTNEFDPPDNALMVNSLKTDLDTTINSLSEREAEIIKLHYGIGGKSSMTLSEIGQLLDITRERVRQIKEMALKKLKRSSSSSLLLKYL